MISHTYQFHLDSDVIRLPNVDDLLGKEVEVIVREVSLPDMVSNFEELDRLLTQKASPNFFSDVQEPVDWQKQSRCT